MAVKKVKITKEEYDVRLAKVREKMREKNAEVLIVDQVEHVGYLTGYLPTAAMYQALVVPLNEEPVVILRALDESAFKEQSPHRNYVMFNDWEDPIQITIDLFQSKGWDKKRIGLEMDSNFLLPVRYEAFKKAFHGGTIVDFSEVLWEIKLIKSEYEIECLRNAGKIA